MNIRGQKGRYLPYIIKIPCRQGRREAPDQSVHKGTLREEADRERRMRGISMMYIKTAKGRDP
jgi:hypothetical protein